MDTDMSAQQATRLFQVKAVLDDLRWMNDAAVDCDVAAIHTPLSIALSSSGRQALDLLRQSALLSSNDDKRSQLAGLFSVSDSYADMDSRRQHDVERSGNDGLSRGDLHALFGRIPDCSATDATIDLQSDESNSDGDSSDGDSPLGRTVLETLFSGPAAGLRPQAGRGAGPANRAPPSGSGRAHSHVSAGHTAEYDGPRPLVAPTSPVPVAGNIPDASAPVPAIAAAWPQAVSMPRLPAQPTTAFGATEEDEGAFGAFGGPSLVSGLGSSLLGSLFGQPAAALVGAAAEGWPPVAPELPTIVDTDVGGLTGPGWAGIASWPWAGQEGAVAAGTAAAVSTEPLPAQVVPSAVSAPLSWAPQVPQTKAMGEHQLSPHGSSTASASVVFDPAAVLDRIQTLLVARSFGAHGNGPEAPVTGGSHLSPLQSSTRRVLRSRGALVGPGERWLSSCMLAAAQGVPNQAFHIGQPDPARTIDCKQQGAAEAYDGAMSTENADTGSVEFDLNSLDTAGVPLLRRPGIARVASEAARAGCLYLALEAHASTLLTAAQSPSAVPGAGGAPQPHGAASAATPTAGRISTLVDAAVARWLLEFLRGYSAVLLSLQQVGRVGQTCGAGEDAHSNGASSVDATALPGPSSLGPALTILQLQAALAPWIRCLEMVAGTLGIMQDTSGQASSEGTHTQIHQLPPPRGLHLVDAVFEAYCRLHKTLAGEEALAGHGPTDDAYPSIGTAEGNGGTSAGASAQCSPSRFDPPSLLRVACGLLDVAMRPVLDHLSQLLGLAAEGAITCGRAAQAGNGMSSTSSDMAALQLPCCLAQALHHQQHWKADPANGATVMGHDADLSASITRRAQLLQLLAAEVPTLAAALRIAPGQTDDLLQLPTSGMHACRLRQGLIHGVAQASQRVVEWAGQAVTPGTGAVGAGVSTPGEHTAVMAALSHALPCDEPVRRIPQPRLPETAGAQSTGQAAAAGAGHGLASRSRWHNVDDTDDGGQYGDRRQASRGRGRALSSRLAGIPEGGSSREYGRADEDAHSDGSADGDDATADDDGHEGLQRARSFFAGRGGRSSSLSEHEQDGPGQGAGWGAGSVTSGHTASLSVALQPCLSSAMLPADERRARALADIREVKAEARRAELERALHLKSNKAQELARLQQQAEEAVRRKNEDKRAAQAEEERYGRLLREADAKGSSPLKGAGAAYSPFAKDKNRRRSTLGAGGTSGVTLEESDAAGGVPGVNDAASPAREPSRVPGREEQLYASARAQLLAQFGRRLAHITGADVDGDDATTQQIGQPQASGNGAILLALQALASLGPAEGARAAALATDMSVPWPVPGASDAAAAAEEASATTSVAGSEAAGVQTAAVEPATRHGSPGKRPDSLNLFRAWPELEAALPSAAVQAIQEATGFRPSIRVLQQETGGHDNLGTGAGGLGVLDRPRLAGTAGTPQSPQAPVRTSVRVTSPPGGRPNLQADLSVTDASVTSALDVAKSLDNDDISKPAGLPSSGAVAGSADLQHTRVLQPPGGRSVAVQLLHGGEDSMGHSGHAADASGSQSLDGTAADASDAGSVVGSQVAHSASLGPLQVRVSQPAGGRSTVEGLLYGGGREGQGDASARPRATVASEGPTVGAAASLPGILNATASTNGDEPLGGAKRQLAAAGPGLSSPGAKGALQHILDTGEDTGADDEVATVASARTTVRVLQPSGGAGLAMAGVLHPSTELPSLEQVSANDSGVRTSVVVSQLPGGTSTVQGLLYPTDDTADTASVSASEAPRPSARRIGAGDGSAMAALLEQRPEDNIADDDGAGTASNDGHSVVGASAMAGSVRTSVALRAAPLPRLKATDGSVDGSAVARLLDHGPWGIHVGTAGAGHFDPEGQQMLTPEQAEQRLDHMQRLLQQASVLPGSNMPALADATDEDACGSAGGAAGLAWTRPSQSSMQQAFRRLLGRAASTGELEQLTGRELETALPASMRHASHGVDGSRLALRSARSVPVPALARAYMPTHVDGAPLPDLMAASLGGPIAQRLAQIESATVAAVILHSDLCGHYRALRCWMLMGSGEVFAEALYGLRAAIARAHMSISGVNTTVGAPAVSADLLCVLANNALSASQTGHGYTRRHGVYTAEIRKRLAEDVAKGTTGVYDSAGVVAISNTAGAGTGTPLGQGGPGSLSHVTTTPGHDGADRANTPSEGLQRLMHGAAAATGTGPEVRYMHCFRYVPVEPGQGLVGGQSAVAGQTGYRHVSATATGHDASQVFALDAIRPVYDPHADPLSFEDRLSLDVVHRTLGSRHGGVAKGSRHEPTTAGQGNGNDRTLLGLVMTPTSLSRYAAMHSFLLRLRWASVELREAWRTLMERKKRHTPRVRGWASNSAEDAVTGLTIPLPVYLFRHEAAHVLSALDGYITTGAVEGSFAGLLDGTLRALQSGSLTDLQQAHENYTRRLLTRAMLPEPVGDLSGDTASRAAGGQGTRSGSGAGGAAVARALVASLLASVHKLCDIIERCCGKATPAQQPDDDRSGRQGSVPAPSQLFSAQALAEVTQTHAHFKRQLATLKAALKAADNASYGFSPAQDLLQRLG